VGIVRLPIAARLKATFERRNVVIKGRVIAHVFNHRASVRNRRSVPTKGIADLGQAAPQNDMGQIHGQLAGSGGADAGRDGWIRSRIGMRFSRAIKLMTAIQALVPAGMALARSLTPAGIKG
jgi:hypothetical protein